LYIKYCENYHPLGYDTTCSGSQLPKLPNGSIFEGEEYMEYVNTVYIYKGR